MGMKGIRMSIGDKPGRGISFGGWIVLAGILIGSVVCRGADPASYVDPRIGNVSWFLVPTYPTFQQPNQMLRMFPVKENYISDEVQAFPLQVISHRSAGIFRIRLSTGAVASEDWELSMPIDHDLEIMHPWYYETTLIEEDIQVAFTPGKKAAIYRFAFPSSPQKNILLSGTGSMEARKEGANAFSLIEKYTYRSRSPAHTPVEMKIWCYGELTDAEGRPIKDVRINAAQGRLRIECGQQAPDTVFFKYAVSYVSEKQARKNYRAEVAEQTFDGVAAAARSAWDTELGKIQVTGGTTAQKRTFYTSLYRTHERMIDINEDGHYYSGYDGRVHASDRPFYVDDWIWDTFRAQHPLRTILAPAQEEDMLHSYVEMARQSGWMPTFPGVAGNHPCMNCYHSSAIFLDAHRKGLKNFDMDAAYAAVRKNLTEGSWIPWRQGAEATPLDERMKKLGYMPALHPGEEETEPYVDGFERRQSVAVSLGRSYDTWVMSEWAKELGRTSDHNTFAADEFDEYKQLWHPEHRLFMPKDEKGEWIDIDPKSAGGPGYRDYFDENNGWTYAWLVQHDIPGLMELLGGPEEMVKRLDQLFREPLGMRRREFYVHGANSTGMVGQFSMGKRTVVSYSLSLQLLRCTVEDPAAHPLPA